MYIIGQVKEFDGEVGIIISVDYYYGGEYLFLKKDLESDEISVGDMVEFRAEKKHDTLRAYFITKRNDLDKNISILIK